MAGTNELVSPDAVSSTLFIGLANARVRGDPWKPLAEEHLGEFETLLKQSKKSSFEAVRLYASAADKVDSLDKKVLFLCEKLAESLWTARGNKNQDPLLSVLTPGTPSFFFEWSIGTSSDRVEAVVAFVANYVANGTAEHAALVDIQAFLAEYRQATESARALRAKIDVFEKMIETFARLGHVQYSRLRRRMQAEGFDPDEIRQVFPDIPGKRISATFA